MMRLSILITFVASCYVLAQEDASSSSKTGGEVAARIIATVVLTLLAGLFSGLTLGLMSLEPLDLKLLIKSGTARQAKYASRIAPIRRHGNRLLTTLVLTNTAIYTAMPIVVSDLIGGTLGFILSTTLSVLFGEIVPQAICSRHGLLIGANTVWLVRILLVLLFPLAWPIAKLLDLILGREIAHSYTRSELTELVRAHERKPSAATSGGDDDDDDDESLAAAAGGDLNRDEITIILNALKFSKTVVADALTPLEKVYMLPITGRLNFQTMREMSRMGHSRVPVYDGVDRGHVVGLLILKQLILLSPDLATPIRKIVEITQYQVPYVSVHTSLDVMLNEFQWGRSHVALVRKRRTELTDEEREKYELKAVATEGSGNAKKKKKKLKASKASKATKVQAAASGGKESGGSSGVATVSSSSTNAPLEKLRKQLTDDEKYVTVGIVTLEDVIEVLLGEDIADENDFDEHVFAQNEEPYSERLERLMFLAVAAQRWRAAASLAADRQSAGAGKATAATTTTTTTTTATAAAVAAASAAAASTASPTDASGAPSSPSSSGRFTSSRAINVNVQNAVEELLSASTGHTPSLLYQ